MNKRIVTSFLAVLLIAPVVSGQIDTATTAEIRISFPDGVAPDVTLVPGNKRITLELPRGASFPMDFAGSTGGLVHDGEVSTLPDGRLQLELQLASGLLDRVEYRSGEVVLHLISRYAGETGATQDEDFYVLGPDDKIRVSVHGHDDLSTELTISDAGTISAPLIGELRAAGSTPGQLTVRLAEILGRNYLVDPQVDVEVIEFRSQWVMVSGEVRIAGRVALRGGTRLKEAISEAGGFSEFAGEQLIISRSVAGSDDTVSVTVPRSAFEAGEANPILYDGDFVDVPKASFAYVHGEVRTPGRVRIERDMTLLKAISILGGLTQWADRKEVRILHREGGETTETVVNLKKIQNGKERDPILTGGEMVVIKRRFF